MFKTISGSAQVNSEKKSCAKFWFNRKNMELYWEGHNILKKKQKLPTFLDLLKNCK